MSCRQRLRALGRKHTSQCLLSSGGNPRPEKGKDLPRVPCRPVQPPHWSLCLLTLRSTQLDPRSGPVQIPSRCPGLPGGLSKRPGVGGEGWGLGEPPAAPAAPEDAALDPALIFLCAPVGAQSRLPVAQHTGPARGSWAQELLPLLLGLPHAFHNVTEGVRAAGPSPETPVGQDPAPGGVAGAGAWGSRRGPG